MAAPLTTGLLASGRRCQRTARPLPGPVVCQVLGWGLHVPACKDLASLLGRPVGSQRRPGGDLGGRRAGSAGTEVF